MKARLSLPDIENTLHHLNYRWNLENLALWKGDKVPFEVYGIYEGYEDFISLETLACIDVLDDRLVRNRLRYALIDHYLQQALLPHETEMRSWMRGAAAHVKGHKVRFKDIIPWCQKDSTFEKRRILQKETGPLCKFLKPFPLNYWNVMLEILKSDLGFDNYLDYCHAKKGIDYSYYCEILRDFLEETDDIYFPVMEKWVNRRFGRSLKALTRFDAISLLSLSEFDGLFPEKTMEELTRFFEYWGIDLENTAGLSLELGIEEEKSAQAMCFILQAPEEVYILMKPEGGWIDLETLWHELGHGLSAVYTSPGLSIVDRDMATSFSLSESFAFLLQNLTMSPAFLKGYLGLNPSDAENLYYHKVLKDLSVFRRYAAKFLVEYKMFTGGDLSDGGPYAELLARYTGFYYQPESHLFDLVPEFYSLDYILGWIAEGILEDHLRKKLGSDWIFCPGTGQILKKWWKQGNRYDIFNFLDRNDIGPFSPDMLLKRWRTILS